MRYTKEKQVEVIADIKAGFNIPDCSAKHGVPSHTIYRWMVAEEPYNTELNSRIYKYAKTVIATEAKITTSISHISGIEVDDEAWDDLCSFVSNELYKLSQCIIEREEAYWKERGAL